MDAVAARRRTPLQYQQHQYPATTSSPLPTAASGLNPNAPLFVPRAYRAVEDFSDQWWRLVESSAWFRDYWFGRQQEQQQQQLLQHTSNKEVLELASAMEGSGAVDSDDVVLPDADALFHGYQPAEEEKRYPSSMRNTTSTTLSWVSSGGGGSGFSSSSAAADDWRFVERAARAMNINTSPWVMQHQM